MTCEAMAGCPLNKVPSSAYQPAQGWGRAERQAILGYYAHEMEHLSVLTRSG